MKTQETEPIEIMFFRCAGAGLRRGVFDVSSFVCFTKYNLFNKINNPHTKHLTRFRFILFLPFLAPLVFCLPFFVLFFLAIIQQTKRNWLLMVWLVGRNWNLTEEWTKRKFFWRLQKNCLFFRRWKLYLSFQHLTEHIVVIFSIEFFCCLFFFTV